MNDEEKAEKKLKRIAGAKDLSIAIKNLERKKKVMEEDLKDAAHYLFENFNPINILNRTLENVKKSSSSKYILFKKSLQFGAGYLSKRKIFDDIKTALINTFKIPVKKTTQRVVVVAANPGQMNNIGKPTDDKKKNERNELTK